MRRLLHAYPDSDLLWWLSVQANRTLMPILRYLDSHFATPERVLAVLFAGVVIPLLAWWTRYWFATALAGHMLFFALAAITLSIFRRGTLSVPPQNPSDVLWVMQPSLPGFLFLGLTVFVLIMCIADHVAFFLFFAGLFRRRPQRQPNPPGGDLRSL